MSRFADRQAQLRAAEQRLANARRRLDRVGGPEAQAELRAAEIDLAWLQHRLVGTNLLKR